MTFTATERYAYGISGVGAVQATQLLVSAFEKTFGRQVANEYDALAREMARVATPYTPCTDIVLADVGALQVYGTPGR